MFSFRHLIGVAGRLLRPPAGEAEHRSAVNRAYYAAFGEAKALATRHGYAFVPGGGGSHDQVWRFLRHGAPGVSVHHLAAWRSVSSAGIALRADRVTADYKPEIAVSMADATTAVARAQTTVARIVGLP